MAKNNQKTVESINSTDTSTSKSDKPSFPFSGEISRSNAISRYDLYAIVLFALQIYMYFSMLDFSRYIVGRVLYSWSALNLTISIAFGVQFFLFFFALGSIITAYRSSIEEEKYQAITRAMQFVLIFLGLNFLSEIAILLTR